MENIPFYHNGAATLRRSKILQEIVEKMKKKNQ